MRVLVSGSTGFVGRHLVPRLRDEGDEVLALAREASSGSPGPHWQTVAAPRDLSAIDADMAFPEGIDAVIHLAALNPERGTAGASDANALMAANAEGTARLAERAAKAGVKRFLFLSSANVHEPRDGAAVIEDEAPSPQNAYAASKLAGERRLAESLSDSATRYTILRPAPVYGAGGRGAVASLARLAALPVPLPFARLKNRRSVLAVDNLVDAILQSLAHPAACDDVFLVADDDPPTMGELVEMMRSAAGRPNRLFSAPEALIAGALGLAGAGEAGRRLTQGFVVDTSKARLRLSWRPRLTTSEAIADMHASLRERTRRT